jgi:RNA polymerase sigma factor (sigma-70 family)
MGDAGEAAIPRHHVKELSAFFAAHDQWLFGHACVRTQGDRELAADLVQDTFEAAAVGWAALREHPAGRQRAWLLGPLAHKDISELRRRSAFSRRLPELEHGEIAELAADSAAGRQARSRLDDRAGPLTADERAGLERAAERGRLAQNRLLEAHLRLVVSIAERYADRGVPFLDLVRGGSAGLARAVEKYPPGKGYAFGTYASWWIRQGIARALASQAGTARIPVLTAEALAEIVTVQRRLARELGREPTPEELAAELGARPE